MKYLVMLLLAFPLIAHAGQWDLGIGFSDRVRYAAGWDYTLDSGDAWHAQINLGLLSHFKLYHIGAHLPKLRHRNTFYWGGSLLYQGSNAFISIGVIEINIPTPYLTSKYQFLDNIGYRFGAYKLTFRHISNGNTGGRNGGESMIYLSADY